MSIAEFREKCKEFALKQVDIQKKDFKRLGVRGDFDNPYITLNMKQHKFVYLVKWQTKV